MGWVKNATPEVEALSQWPMIIPVISVMTILSTVIVSLRLWIRHKARGLALDDHFSTLSMVFAIIYSALSIAQTRYGLGLPIRLRPKPNLIPFTRVNYAGRPFYQLGISFFKIALLISYLRLLQGTDHKMYRMVVWAVAAFVFLSHLGCTLALVFACDPVDKSWNPLKDGTCLPPGPSFTGYAVVTIISDVIVTILPIPILLRLNVKLEKKLGLIVVFILGIFTTICSVMRYSQINRIQFGDGNSTMLVLWGTIEFNVGNIVSSLPFLAPVFVRKAKGYRSKHSGSYGKSNSHAFGAKSGDRYKLSAMNHKTDNFSSNDRGNSEENILAPNSIIKSVTYTVQVDDDAESAASRKETMARGTAM